MSHIPPRKTSSFRSVAEEIVLDSDEDEACVPVTPSGTALRPPVLTLECRTEGRSSNTVIDPSLKSFEGEAPLAAAVGKRKASGPSYGTSTGSDSRKRTRYELPPGARRETRQGSSTGSAYPPLASTVAAYSTPKRYSRSGSGSRSDYDNRSSLSTRPPPPAPAKTYNFPRVRPPPSNSYGSPVSPSPSPINSSFPHVDSPPPLGKYRKDNRAFRPPLRPKGNTPTSVLNTASDASGAKEQATIPPLDDDISRFITNVPSEPIYVNGRFGDIFKATHQTIGEVALKRLRIAGATVDDEVIRLCETSDAVDYLHSENIIHGDIKSTNILINASGHILLCDFGLSKSITDQTSTALKGAGTPRWQSPELWDNAAKTFASDVYAFSMTIVEVMGL
ncbi:hypothetical protein FRC01_013501 [Tulasnella sp. 417]|nr:hypothetical protein FRC01_013501 [Tulasnella sp. 417]